MARLPFIAWLAAQAATIVAGDSSSSSSSSASAGASASAGSSSISYEHIYYHSLPQSVGVNTKYQTTGPSTTKWIGVNTQWLTDLPITTTSAGKVATTTQDIGVGITTTTAIAASGSAGAEALDITISPQGVAKLQEAVTAACGAKSRKRQACSLPADSLAPSLEPVMNSLLSAADLELLAVKLGLTPDRVISAVTFGLALRVLSDQVVPSSYGINVEAMKNGTPQSATSSTSSTSKVATTTLDTDLDPSYPFETDASSIAAEGSVVISMALSNTWWNNLGRPTFSCSNYANPHATVKPQDYCVCADGKSYSTTAGPNPCPYTSAPASTVQFTTPTPSTTSAPTSKSTSTPSITSKPSTTSSATLALGSPRCFGSAAFSVSAASSAASVLCSSAVQSSWAYPATAVGSRFQGAASQNFPDVPAPDGKSFGLSMVTFQRACTPGQPYSVNFATLGMEKCQATFMKAVNGCQSAPGPVNSTEDSGGLVYDPSGESYGGIVYQDCLTWQIDII